MNFNEIIRNLGLLEIPLKGRKFTWSNMQNEPLLEQIDWVFTSINWTCYLPVHFLLLWPDQLRSTSFAKFKMTLPSLRHKFSDWLSILVFMISSNLFGLLKLIPRTVLLEFLLYSIFWEQLLKKWSKNLSNLSSLIRNCSNTLQILDTIEEQRIVFIRKHFFSRIRMRVVYLWIKREKGEVVVLYSLHPYLGPSKGLQEHTWT